MIQGVYLVDSPDISLPSEEMLDSSPRMLAEEDWRCTLADD